MYCVVLTDTSVIVIRKKKKEEEGKLLFIFKGRRWCSNIRNLGILLLWENTPHWALTSTSSCLFPLAKHWALDINPLTFQNSFLYYNYKYFPIDPSEEGTCLLVTKGQTASLTFFLAFSDYPGCGLTQGYFCSPCWKQVSSWPDFRREQLCSGKFSVIGPKRTRVYCTGF